MPAIPSVSLRGWGRKKSAEESSAEEGKEAVAPAPALPVTKYVYGEVTVTRPITMNSGGLFGSQGAYWTYEVQSEINGQVVGVRRRFRQIVMLEDRLRGSRPGVILPPRPEKHEFLPLEEGHLNQSAAFVKKRARLMQIYLNDLLRHPLIGTLNNPDLHQFLSFPDDLGYAWPECSSSTITRMGAAAAGSVSAMSSEDIYAKAVKSWKPLDDPDGELSVTKKTEQERIGKVFVAVPKMEAMLGLLKEIGESRCATGMELSKLSKDMKTTDAALSKSVEIISFPLLKSGRRVKNLSVNLEDGGMMVLEREFRRGKNELAAFEDRATCLSKCLQKQIKASSALDELDTAKKEVSVWGNYRLGNLTRLSDEANEEANQANQESQEVGDILKGEIVRLGLERRKEWSDSIQIVAKDMMQCNNELRVIWEAALVKIEKEFALAKIEKEFLAPTETVSTDSASTDAVSTESVSTHAVSTDPTSTEN